MALSPSSQIELSEGQVKHSEKTIASTALMPSMYMNHLLMVPPQNLYSMYVSGFVYSVPWAQAGRGPRRELGIL